MAARIQRSLSISLCVHFVSVLHALLWILCVYFEACFHAFYGFFVYPFWIWVSCTLWILCVFTLERVGMVFMLFDVGY